MEKKKKMKKGKVRVPTSKVGFSKGAEVVSGGSIAGRYSYSSPRRCLTGRSRNSARGLDFPWPNAGTGGKRERRYAGWSARSQRMRGSWFRKKVLEEEARARR